MRSSSAGWASTRLAYSASTERQESIAMLVGDIIRLNAGRRAKDEALVTNDGRLTFAELNDVINQPAAALADAGIGTGDRVAVLGKNSIEYVSLYYGLAKL